MPVLSNVFLRPREAGVTGSKVAMRADMPTDRCRRFVAELHEPFRFHRKTWEFCYIMAELEAAGMLQSGRRGVGFAVGQEPLPSAMAARGVDVVISDLPIENAVSKDWGSTKQHAASLEQAHKPEIVDMARFKRRASFRAVDMNVIPYDLLNGTFDFAWSSSSLEHVGSCKRAKRFIKQSVNAVKPGGIVVHTTELVLSSLTQNRDVPGLCLFTKKMMEQVIAELKAQGHSVAPMRWGVGAGARVDYDVKPFNFESHMALLDQESQLVHTSVMLVVRRGRQQQRLSFTHEASVPWYMRLDGTPPPQLRNDGAAASDGSGTQDELRIHPSFLRPASDETPAALPQPRSRLADRADLDTRDCARTLSEFQSERLPVRHRKEWEFCVMTHALDKLGMLQEARRGLGFAVGLEPLASYFVRRGASVVVSDLPKAGAHAGDWNSTAQHAGELLSTWRKGVVDKALYEERASFMPVDMNAIQPELLQGEFDFLWSSSSLEHVGTCALGMDYVLNSLEALRPGGVAIHTTELLISHPDGASDAPHLCFFSKGMMDDLAAQIAAEGHELVGGPIDFHVGVRDQLDFDRPPFELKREHIALVDIGHVHTSILLVIRRGRTRVPDSDLSPEHLTARMRRLTRNASALAAPAMRIPAQHIGLRPFAAATQLAHSGDFLSPDMRRLLLKMGEPLANRHRRQWEMAAIVYALEERGLLVPGSRGLGLSAGESGMTTYMASRGASLTINSRTPVASFRDGLGVAKAAVMKRVQLQLSSETIPSVVERVRESGEQFDFMYSVVALSTFRECNAALRFVKKAVETVRAGGTVAFALTVSIFGPGTSGPDRCELTYPALKRFTLDLKKRGFNVTAPPPQVGWVTDADDFDVPPFAAVDHMVYLHDGQLFTSAVLVVDSPLEPEESAASH